jgi:sRNA-binding carbon storage regulator CsrA
MLVVSRRSEESILINLADGADQSITVADLFANGPIEIMLLGGTGRRVKMGIHAPDMLSIRRKDKSEHD